MTVSNNFTGHVTIQGTVGGKMREVVRIEPDGRIVIADGVALDDASRAFWDAVRSVSSSAPQEVTIRLLPYEYHGLLSGLDNLVRLYGPHHNPDMARHLRQKIAKQSGVDLVER